MASRRTAKVNEAIRETVSTTILFGLKDPRVKNVTVLGAEVSPDLRTAKVFVTIMGDVKTQTLSMHGLNAAKGFIQAKVADRLQTRYTPVLRFVLDPSVKMSIQTSAILHDVLAADRAGTMADAEAADAEAEKACAEEQADTAPDAAAADRQQDDAEPTDDDHEDDGDDEDEDDEQPGSWKPEK